MTSRLEARMRTRRWWAPVVATLALSGCSIRQVAVNGLAGALASSGDVFGSDDDPELVREALPFGLKTMEALLEQSPENRDLLLAATRGFTQYSFAFVEGDMNLLEEDEFDEREFLAKRALNMYLRATDYGLRGLELRHKRLGDELATEPSRAVEKLDTKDLDLAYWTAAAWGGAISLGLDRPEIVADVDAMRALFARVLELDPNYGDGAIHEALISVEALPKAMGGSEERAREHFALAIEAADGLSAGTYVSFANQVSVGNQDRDEYIDLLDKALDIDLDRAPSRRLANILAQRRARVMLERIDDYFLENLD